MIKVKNHLPCDITIDDTVISAYGECLFDIIKDNKKLNQLLNSQKISVLYVATEEKQTKTLSKDTKGPYVPKKKIIENTVSDNDTMKGEIDNASDNN